MYRGGKKQSRDQSFGDADLLRTGKSEPMVCLNFAMAGAFGSISGVSTGCFAVNLYPWRFWRSYGEDSACQPMAASRKIGQF
jgi:hypothetical protein